MRIVTINIPESYLDAIAELVGEKGLYPSRSELIRVAVRQFLLKELEIAKKMEKNNMEHKKEQDFDETKYVRIPIDKIDKEKNEPVREYKIYKILRKLN